jgi:hypothetical protein
MKVGDKYFTDDLQLIEIIEISDGNVTFKQDNEIRTLSNYNMYLNIPCLKKIKLVDPSSKLKDFYDR